MVTDGPSEANFSENELATPMRTN